LSIPKVSVGQIKAARGLLGWAQKEMAGASGVSIPTIKRLEAKSGELGGRDQTRDKIRTALEKAGIEFLAEDDGGPGVRLRKPKRKGRPK
jgi:transcriptional regulator with XRE-family HTH domain